MIIQTYSEYIYIIKHVYILLYLYCTALYIVPASTSLHVTGSTGASATWGPTHPVEDSQAAASIQSSVFILPPSFLTLFHPQFTIIHPPHFFIYPPSSTHFFLYPPSSTLLLYPSSSTHLSFILHPPLFFIQPPSSTLLCSSFILYCQFFIFPSRSYMVNLDPRSSVLFQS